MDPIARNGRQTSDNDSHAQEATVTRTALADPPRAAHAVFDTYELLEHVLWHLPPLSLLRFQRVCKPWKTVIDRSVCIQEALFFREWTVEPDPETALADDEDDFPFNDLVLHVLGITEASVNWIPGPPIVLMQYWRPEDNDFSIGRPLIINDVPESWKDMLVFQPPGDCTLWLKFSKCFVCHKPLALNHEGTLTAGELVHIMERATCECSEYASASDSGGLDSQTESDSEGSKKDDGSRDDSDHERDHHS